MEDEKIIALFFDRSEQAIRELDAKYGKSCHKLSYNILKSKQDAEECVSDAYLGAWNAIPPEKPKPLMSFLLKIVRNISIMRYHSNTAAKRNSTYDTALEELEGCLASPNSVEEELEVKELVSYIEGFLDTLSRENRVIFIRRYWFSDSYSDIGKLLSISEKNVSVRLTRTRMLLRQYLIERGILV